MRLMNTADIAGHSLVVSLCNNSAAFDVGVVVAEIEVDKHQSGTGLMRETGRLECLTEAAWARLVWPKARVLST